MSPDEIFLHQRQAYNVISCITHSIRFIDTHSLAANRGAISPFCRDAVRFKGYSLSTHRVRVAVVHIRTASRTRTRMTGSTKVTIADHDENFPVLFEKVRNGICAVPNCEDKSQLVFYARHLKPYLCYRHQNDGSDTHYGSWVPTENPYYEKWDCCNTSWKLCHCSVFANLFQHRPEIPVTDEQQINADQKCHEAKLQQEENERYERMLNAGRDEAYDR